MEILGMKKKKNMTSKMNSFHRFKRELDILEERISELKIGQ